MAGLGRRNWPINFTQVGFFLEGWCIQSNLLNDHTAMNMEYVLTATFLWGFTTRERKRAEKRRLVFGSGKNLSEKKRSKKKSVK